MGKRIHVSEVLTPLERKYCAFRARGFSKASSFRQAANKPRMAAKDCSSRGVEIEKRPRVISRLRAMLEVTQKQELLGHSQYLQTLIDDQDACREAQNWTAASSYARLIGQAINSLSDTLNVEDRRMGDSTVLIEKLRNAGVLDDKALATLSDKLSAKDTFH